MNGYSPELQTFLDLLNKKERMVAMLAPSFPIDFTYPEIVGKLKRLGFSYVVEVSKGAMETNRQLLELMKKNSKGRFITTPCPSIVKLIHTQYPHLVPFLAPTDSPMVATAKLVLEKYPGFRPVFIGPCLAKKADAKENHPGLRIVVLTFREIKIVFEKYKIEDESSDFSISFDMVGSKTRLYPISGGLSESTGLNAFLTDEEYDVISGIELVKKSLEEFPTTRLKVLDILFCNGGCISGPGIMNTSSLEERRQRVVAHWLPTSSSTSAESSSRGSSRKSRTT